MDFRPRTIITVNGECVFRAFSYLAGVEAIRNLFWRVACYLYMRSFCLIDFRCDLGDI